MANQEAMGYRTSPGIDSGVAQALFIGGCVLLATFTTTIVFSSLPIQLTLPEWQLRLTGNLLGNGTTALVGVLLVAISQKGLSTLDSSLTDIARLIRKLAFWAAIAYLFLIPAQIAAGFRLLSNTAQAEKQPVVQWRQFRARILATESESELRELLSRLPQAPSLPNQFPPPFQKFKEEVVSITDARFAAFETEAEKARSSRLKTLLLDIPRSIIQSLLLAAGLNAASNRSLKFGRRSPFSLNS